VERLRGFGSANRESLAQLVWAFFEYWAWGHNYSQDVVSVRVGGVLHKDDKDWTRRIGNERHLVRGHAARAPSGTPRPHLWQHSTPCAAALLGVGASAARAFCC
jgi:hypothetical protein